MKTCMVVDEGGYAVGTPPMWRDNLDEKSHCLTRNAPDAKTVASCNLLPKIHRLGGRH
jgi:hypothetical protein